MPAENLGPRDSKRRRVLLTGTVFTPDGALRVRIRDISRTGAHVAGGTPFRSDCDAIFKKGDLFVASRVIWVRGAEAGLQFYRELSDEESAGLVQPATESAG